MSSTSTTYIDLRVNNAEQLKESVSEPSSSNLYLTFGKTNAWPNEASPNIANSSVASVYEVWDNMIGGKRITGGDISHVIPRINWESGRVYTAYDHMNPSLFDNPEFYVMNRDYSVYKCISNNRSSVSFIEPTSIKTDGLTLTSDNYVWKYMYTISDGDVLKFTTDTYIPVKTVQADDGSTQWQVQDNARDGAIEFIEITNSGSNYSNAANLIVQVSGDGSGIVLLANITSNVTSANIIDRITVSNPGSGYTYATVSISGGGGSGARARAVISPPGGHGSNPLYELGGKNLMFNVNIKYDEDGVLPETNDFRQISIIKDPKIYNSSNTAGDLAYLQAYRFTTFGSGDYAEDEIVYQGASLNNATFSGRVVSWDADLGILTVINRRGTPSLRALIGTIYSTSRTVTSIQPGRLQPSSGKILYVDNIKNITRASDQIENFKILVKF